MIDMAVKLNRESAPAAPAAPAARVVIVEDDSNLRRTIIAFVNRSPGFCCAGAFPDGETALAEIPLLKPDVVLMDIGLPGMSGIECVSALKEIIPATPILMLTVYDEGDYLFDSLKAGASGYLLKRTIGDKLLEAMQEARAGGLPLTRHMAVKVGEYFQQFGRRQKQAQDEVNTLTPREQEVLKLLADGFRYKEIASQLGISLDTVREHSRRIYSKLHVSSRTEAVVKYLGRSATSPGNG
jgi:DNA-binding NarL/FixJ family response regulator